MYLSNKYFVTALYWDCIEFIKEKIDASNVWRFLEDAKIFDDLKDVCDEVLRESGAEILMSERFLYLSRDAMSAIVGRSDLAANEMLVYERAVDWAKHQTET
ncbi:BTB/POZ domain-containing protein 2 [Aphelenchoides avenae]|nr:BTB/POZ domain-containing protein 2 [Aphelenchus avenae]